MQSGILRYSSVIVISVFFFIILLISNVNAIVENTTTPIEFREQKTYGAQNPSLRIFNRTGIAIQPHSFGYVPDHLASTDQGAGYMFLRLRASMFNGATLSIRHNYSAAGNVFYFINIYDGSYNRTNIIHFPEVAGFYTMGNGLLQTLYPANITSFPTRTDTYVININNALPYVTLFFGVNGGGGVPVPLGYPLFSNLTIVKNGLTYYYTEFSGTHYCDLAEVNLLFCGANGWPDTFFTSSGYLDATIINYEGCYIGETPNNLLFTIDETTSYIYVGNVERSVYLTNASFYVQNYTNPFGDTWISLVIYSASNNQPISNVNPLKAIWQDTILFHNNTIAGNVYFHINIITGDSKYIAVALSSTEPIQINETSTEQTMYSYPVYAPYSIGYLNENADTLGLILRCRITFPTVFSTPATANYRNDWDILNNINALSMSIGFPPIFIYSIMFIIILFAVIIILSKVKKASGDYGKMPPIMLGIFSFSILSFFAISNMLPFEMLIFAIIGVVTVFSLVISNIILGGQTE